MMRLHRGLSADSQVVKHPFSTFWPVVKTWNGYNNYGLRYETRSNVAAVVTPPDQNAVELQHCEYWKQGRL